MNDAVGFIRAGTLDELRDRHRVVVSTPSGAVLVVAEGQDVIALDNSAISSPRDVDRWMRIVFGGKVVPPKQQQEWTELVSTKTGEPIATVSADNPEGFALGLANKMLGPLGAQWFYEGESLGYRTIYVWIADQDLMITVQTNSHPPEGTDKLADAIKALYEIVKR